MSSTMSIPPPPLDDPSVSDPLECPPLRWGIIGCGRVSHDFVQALKHLPSQSVVACAARSVDSAKEFADKHNIPNYSGSYDDVIQNSEVQIVYVGNIHTFRRRLVEQSLLAKKHCLAEKPFALNATDVEYLIGLAKERNLFMLEGMWTRFFPAVEQARRLTFGAGDEKGRLGEVVSVYSDFNIKASDHEHYPTSFMYTHNLGGGASYVMGPYPFAASTLFFGGSMPDCIKATGQVDKLTGVDLQCAVSLSFPPTGDVAPAVDESNTEENTPKLPGCGVAILLFGFLGESEEETIALGTKGRLIIENPSHCPTKLKFIHKGDGHRGSSTGEETYEFPLPADTEEITKAGGFVYPNSAGFVYEAAAVARCIAAGKIEAPQFTLNETLINAKLVDEIRSQLGVKPIE